MHMASILERKVLMPLIWAASSSSRTASILRPCLEFISSAVAVRKIMTMNSAEEKSVERKVPTSPLESAFQSPNRVVLSGMLATPFAPSSRKSLPPTLMVSCKLLKINRIASPTPSVAMQK